MPKITVNEDRCKGCGLCVAVCPKKIIVLAPEHINAKGYYPAQMIDEALCTGCAFCATMCPDTVIIVER